MPTKPLSRLCPGAGCGRAIGGWRHWWCTNCHKKLPDHLKKKLGESIDKKRLGLIDKDQLDAVVNECLAAINTPKGSPAVV